MQHEHNHEALPRLIGTFYWHEWGGRNNDTAIPMGEVEFDATDAILALPYEDLVAIEDDDQSSDEIGLAHVKWNGPHRVEIVDAICEFFGVDELSKITRDMQAEKRMQYPSASKPVRVPSSSVSMDVKLKPEVRNTLLGALRLLQREMSAGRVQEGDPIYGLLTEDGEREPMSPAQIDAFCEAINC